MRQKLGTKFGMIVILILGLLIPIFMIQGLIDDRQALQLEVREDIARSSSGEQRVIGPFLHITYTETQERNGELLNRDKRLMILPESLNLNSKLDTFSKYRGIYKAILYRSMSEMKGRFELSALSSIEFDKIKNVDLVIAIKDIRGIGQNTQIKLDDTLHTLLPGTGISQLPEGVRVNLALTNLSAKQELDFSIDLALQGMQKLSVVPVARHTQVSMNSNWPHPSFVGNYLPIDSTITEQGFTANWQTNFFATNIEELFSKCLFATQCELLNERSLGVSLVESVDHYLKSYRATNYALLVFTLVFACFFLLEVFNAKPLHPIQYGFVGLSLAVFYLLLVSLSEHIGFNSAYLIAAFSSSSLLSVYVSGMLKNTNQGAAFCFGLVCLYGLLFGLLSAEDYALLMGSLLVFLVLNITMLVTRKVDWYQSKEDVIEADGS
ncbi:cell envelope integrity protein CreD [Pseudoalteromonas phenolica]|uniref:cell envelope integrity protein CreD n=1 Tax=Pseudoalteromonas phenolica TaxID=161398 RepID=UPI001BB15C55|nr:cell envelope integrity protein CreD [Pseudoalteromonas phenolica]